MRLLKVVAILGLGFYYVGLQAEWRESLIATYDAFVERWAGFKAPALPSDLVPLISQSAVR